MRGLKVVAAAVPIIIGLGTGSAFAFWKSSGTGRGTATIGASGSVTLLAATGTASSKLYPGGPAADLVLRITNSNSYAVTLTAIQGNGAAAAPGASGCSTTGVSAVALTGLSITVPAGPSDVHVVGGATMSTASDSGCQNATFQIPVTITVQK